MRYRNSRVISAAGVLLCLAFAVSAAETDVLASLPGHTAIAARVHGSAQPSLEMLTKLGSTGVRTVINLRPDTETPDLDEKSVVEKSGLIYRSLPIAGKASLTRENVTAFDKMLAEAKEGEVLVHCASGNRVGAMMALRARWLLGKSPDEAMAIGKAAGLTGLAADVRSLVEAAPVSAVASGGTSK
jgi:uncharacterized protein (TIGR01244 family)